MEKRERYFVPVLYLCKLVVFKFQPIAHIHTKGKQRDGNFGDHTGVIVFDKGVVAANIDNRAEHTHLL